MYMLQISQWGVKNSFAPDEISCKQVSTFGIRQFRCYRNPLQPTRGRGRIQMFPRIFNLCKQSICCRKAIQLRDMTLLLVGDVMTNNDVIWSVDVEKKEVWLQEGVFLKCNVMTFQMRTEVWTVINVCDGLVHTPTYTIKLMKTMKIQITYQE